MITYISIGNSDDKLTQGQWAVFMSDLHALVHDACGEGTRCHGVWYSAPDSPFQNMCVCLELPDDPALAVGLKRTLASLAFRYRQDSIALATAQTELVRAEGSSR